MDLTAVQKAYARWAPHYDVSFGLISDYGRQKAVEMINKKVGRVLEVGVGTGLSLPYYSASLKVTGIDLSENMLKRARLRVFKEKLTNIDSLEKKDATDTGFASNSFDVAVAMYLMSVAPEPEKILSEMARVVKLGGDIYILNHFASSNKRFKIIEKAMSPICRFIGWHSTFERSRVMGCESLSLEEAINVQPFNLFTLLRFRKIDF